MLSNKEEYSLALIGKYRTELLGVATVMILFFHSTITFSFLHFSALQMIGEALKSVGRMGVDIF